MFFYVFSSKIKILWLNYGNFLLKKYIFRYEFQAELLGALLRFTQVRVIYKYFFIIALKWIVMSNRKFTNIWHVC